MRAVSKHEAPRLAQQQKHRLLAEQVLRKKFAVDRCFVLTNVCTIRHAGLMEVDALEFDWDGGNREKCQKHGLSVQTIESIFKRPVAVFPDPEHSGDEERFIGIGKTGDGRSVLVAFTLRRRDQGILLRPISARYMHKKEADHYEKETSHARKRR